MKRETKIGLFAALVLLSTFLIINYLRGADVFDKEITIISHFPTIEGLEPSNPVIVKGYKAGSVTRVTYNPETDMFDVTCSVLKKIRIPEDSRMTIHSVDLMGGKGIRLDLGTSSEMVRNKAELKADYAPDLVSSLTNLIGPLIVKVSAMLDSLSTTAEGLNRILAAVDEKTIKSSVDHLEGTLANVDRFSGMLAANTSSIDSLIINLRDVSARLVSICEGADKAVDNVGKVTDNLTEADLKGLVESLKMLSIRLNDTEGTIGKLINDGEAYDSINNLLSDVDSLVRRIEADPKKYLKFKVTLF